MKKIMLDINHIKELYLSGKTVNQIAAIMGVSNSVIENRARQEGVRFKDLRPMIHAKPHTNRKSLPADEIVRMYKSGMSKTAIAQHFNVGQMTISLRLKEAGYDTAPTRSEAGLIAMSRLSPEERLARASAAHDAVRGMTRTVEDLEKRALGKERAAKLTSAYEISFRDFLTEQGIAFIPQKAIGVYNCDFTIGTVAVELFGGGFHGIGRHAERLPERMRYLLNEGWNVYIVWVLSNEKIIYPCVLDDFIAFEKRASLDPSFRGQYRVIWSDGELISTGNGNRNDFANVIPPRMRNDALSKNRRS